MNSMPLRIVTWNMDSWKHPGQTRAVWEYLGSLAPDLALIQEACWAFSDHCPVVAEFAL